MKRTFLEKLKINGVYYSIGALLLLLGAPLYQLLLLAPQGYNDALASANSSLSLLLWIGTHQTLYLGYRALLVAAFLLLYTLPFTLFRIIVAQELLGVEEENKETDDAQQEAQPEERKQLVDMPDYAWRGKGFAVIAAWAGLSGIIATTLGISTSTLYLAFASSTATATHLPNSFSFIASILAIIPNTVGGGLLALSNLLFGAMIARRGRNLWPGIWVNFSYLSLALGALFSASAAEVATSPASERHILTTPVLFLFALWVLWFGIMLVRLKPESE